MSSLVRRLCASVIVGAFALAGAVAGDVAAQEEDEGFPLTAFTAICPPGEYGGPFVGCTPWEGVVVTFANADDPNWTRTCETAGTERAASCTIEVPFGSTIIGSIMPSVIPEGYALKGDLAVEYTIPDGPPDGVFGGPTFVIQPVEGEPAEEPVPTEDPVVDEPEEPVVDETPVGDEPADDPVESEGGKPISLPSTGSGAAPASSAVTAGLLAGAATLLSAGAYGLRRVSR